MQPANATMSREELVEILQRENFRYQRMSLPYGLATAGHDRSSTAELIFDDDLQGCSVLDIGCLNGFFCYEAKRRNAGRVVGVEIDPERFRHAQILQGINGVDIELRNEDFFDTIAKERFDYVLFLNVVHHLEDPIDALYQIGECVQKRFIMEFPSFADVKFRRKNGRLLRCLYWLLNRLPLIGVGATGKRPRFAFSPRALERLLVGQAKIYHSIRFMRSPFQPGRLIAVCDK